MTEAWSSSADSSRSPFGLPRPSSELSDSDLCARIRDHRPESAAAQAAYGELYARHQLPALHFALRLNRNRAQAEDAVAEAFAKIWRAWGHGKGPDESFKAYLMAAVRSESYRRTAMVRATTIVEPDVLTFLAGSEPGNHAAEVAERDQLGRAFKTLPDAWQSALILIDIDGTSTADAAATMDLSSNSFSSLLRRAREGLRAAYLQEHVEPGAPECLEYSSALARLVRQQLSPKRAEAIEAHLSHCSDCRRQSFKLRSVNATFQAWITPAALAAALIEWGHFPEAAALLTGAGTANIGPGGHSGAANIGSGGQSGTVAAEPHSSAAAAVSKSSTGTAAAGSSGGSTAGIAAGASAVKVAIAGIAASAAIAAGAATLVNLQSDPAPQSAAAAETSSAPVDPPKTTPSSPSPPRTAGPDGGDESDEGSDQREHNAAGRSAPGDAERSRASRETAQAPAPQEETQTPSSSDRQQPTDNDEEQEPAEVPSAEPDEPSSETTTETAEPTPAEEPTDSNEPNPEPSSTPSAPAEPSSDSSSESSKGTGDAAANSDAGSSTAPSEPDAGVDSTSEADADADDSTAADASDASGADGEDPDEGPHCHVVGWWEFCH